MWLKHSEAGEILILVKTRMAIGIRSTVAWFTPRHNRLRFGSIIVLTRLNQSIDAFERSGMFEARKK